VVEGEKDVHSLETLNLVATSASGGAGKWRPEYSESLKGRLVIVIPDNDDPGRAHAKQVVESLAKVATPRLLELPGLPPKGDVTDWIAAGGTRDKLAELLKVKPNPIRERIARMRRELDELERLVG
jgi:DNA primase